MNYPAYPYDEWPKDTRARELIAQHHFGLHLMMYVRDEAQRKIPGDAPAASRKLAETAVDNALYAMMQLLDGYWDNEVDGKHKVTYQLRGLVTDVNGKVCDEVELAPDGDGLCMGIHAWKEGDFGQDIWAKQHSGNLPTAREMTGT